MSDICPLCSPIDEAVLWRDGFCRVIWVEDAHYPGFCRVILNAHIKEMTDMAPAERQRLMAVVFAVEAAVREAVRPDKINLASLGNMVPHLHWQVIPRWADDVNFPDAVWAPARRAPLSRGVGADLRQRLAGLLEERLLPARTLGKDRKSNRLRSKHPPSLEQDQDPGFSEMEERGAIGTRVEGRQRAFNLEPSIENSGASRRRAGEPHEGQPLESGRCGRRRWRGYDSPTKPLVELEVGLGLGNRVVQRERLHFRFPSRWPSCRSDPRRIETFSDVLKNVAH